MNNQHAYLAGVVARPRQGPLPNEATYRRYGSTVHTWTTMQGVPDHDVKSITYEVGRRGSSITSAMGPHNPATNLIEASVRVADFLCTDLAGLARRHSNFTGNFEYMNLAGVVERLGKALAARATYEGPMSTADIRAGQPFNVFGLGYYDTPVAAHNSTVFIPRLVDSLIRPDVFSVLASACAGEGADIATDIVTLGPDQAPVIAEVSGDALFPACVGALRLLGSNFASSECGDLFAYALARGIHSVLTVVGHTDEGAVLRSAFRCGGFTVPFGGIHYQLPDYIGLPGLTGSNPVAWASYVDSIALMTAGLVAHCDPGTTYNGLWYPTVLLGADIGVQTVRPGQNQAGTAEMAGRNKSQLVVDFPRFAVPYCDALAKLFGFAGTSGVAARHFSAAVTALPPDERHLRYPSVSPYFWIEPTSLIDHDFANTPCEAEGFASYATKGLARTLPGWESIERRGHGDGVVHGSFVARLRSARTAPILAHLNGHPLNGLGGVTVVQLDPNGVVHPGPCPDYEDVRDRVEAALPITSYLWTRGQSPFCAPGEFINIGENIGLGVHHVTVDLSTGAPKMEHLPGVHEFEGCEVTFSVSVPIGLAAGPSNYQNSDARRAKTRAVASLSAAIMRARIYGRPEVIDLPVLTTAPVLHRDRGIRGGGGALAIPEARDFNDANHAIGGGGMRVQAVAGITAPLAGAGGPAATTRLAPTVHHGATVGPRPPPAVPQLPAGAGGGGIARARGHPTSTAPTIGGPAPGSAIGGGGTDGASSSAAPLAPPASSGTPAGPPPPDQLGGDGL